MKKLIRFVLLTFVIAVTNESFAEVNLKNMGKTMSSINLNDTKKWCLGRYTFEVSKDAKFLEQRDRFDSFDIKVISTNATKADFENEVEKRIQSYKVRDRFILDQTLDKYYDKSLTKIIWAKLSPTDSTVDVFAYVLDRGTLFTIEGSYGKKFGEESKEAIYNLVQNLKSRPNNLFPTSKGYCINNGFIADDGNKYRHSRQTLFLNFPNYPSVDIEFQTEAIWRNDGGMIARTTKNLKDSGRLATFLSHVKTIKKGKREVNGFAGEEWINEAPMKGKNGIDAIWEYSGVVNQSLSPAFFISFTSGNDLKTQSTSISTAEALTLYENILKTIKIF